MPTKKRPPSADTSEVQGPPVPELTPDPLLLAYRALVYIMEKSRWSQTRTRRILAGDPEAELPDEALAVLRQIIGDDTGGN